MDETTGFPVEIDHCAALDAATCVESIGCKFENNACLRLTKEQQLLNKWNEVLTQANLPLDTLTISETKLANALVAVTGDVIDKITAQIQEGSLKPDGTLNTDGMVTKE